MRTICLSPIAPCSKRTLRRIAADYRSARGTFRSFGCCRKREFLEKLYTAAYKARALVCGFNLPFDLSRLACKFSNARDRFTGGFSLALWEYTDDNGERREDKYRPRIAIKHIDSKRALKGFTGRLEPDTVDQIPEGSTTGEPIDHTAFAAISSICEPLHLR